VKARCSPSHSPPIKLACLTKSGNCGQNPCCLTNFPCSPFVVFQLKRISLPRTEKSSGTNLTSISNITMLRKTSEILLSVSKLPKDLLQISRTLRPLPRFLKKRMLISECSLLKKPWTDSMSYLKTLTSFGKDKKVNLSQIPSLGHSRLSRLVSLSRKLRTLTHRTLLQTSMFS
jgi:hypothetical protein